MAGERKLTVTWDGKDVGLARAADKAASDVADANDKIGDSFEDAGNDGGDSFLDGLGGKITAGIAAIGIAGGALLVEGLTSAMDLEVTTDKLAAQLGPNNMWAESAGEIAGDLYAAGFGDTVADTGEAVRKIIQAGLSPDLTDEALEGITTKFLTFTDVLDQDMDMTVQAVQSMFTSGIVASAEEGLDVMTAAIQAGGDKAGDLAETFQEYGTSFRELGLSGADAAGLMIQGLDAGARDADKVADAIKEFGIRAQDGSQATRDAFTAIGLDAETAMLSVAAGGDSARLALQYTLEELNKMEDPVARNAAAVALFGTQAEDLGDALYSLDLTTAADNLGSYAGATDELSSAYDNASSKIESFKRTALMELTEFVGGTVIPGIEDLVSLVRDTLGPTFTEVKDSMTTFIAAFQVGEGFGGGGIFTVMGEAGAALGNAWRELVDTYNVELKPALEDLAVKGREIIEDIDWQTVWQELGPILSAAGGAFMSFMTMAITAIATVISNITSFITKLQEMWREHESFRVIVTAVWDLVSQKVTSALNIMSGAMRLITAVMQGDWSGAWNAIKQIASNAWNSMTAEFRGISNTIRGIGGAMWNPISSGLSSVVSNVESQINRLIKAYNSIPFLPNVSTLSTGPARNLAINRIPKLAAGGVVTSPTLAWLAEAGQPEAVVPLERAGDMGFGGGGGDGQPIRVQLVIDGQTLIDATRKAVRNRGGIDVVFAA